MRHQGRRATRLASLAGGLILACTLLACGADPTAQEVQDTHRAEARDAQQESAAALAPLDGAGEQLAEAVRDSCVTGQHNWKVDDPYDVLCTLQVHRAYHVTGSDFRAAADTVTAAFPACADSDAEATLRDYWDQLEGTQTHNFPGPYRPDYLPDYRLDCQGGDVTGEESAVSLTVTGWASLPVDEETRSLREYGMGRPCVNDTQDTPCRWDGISAREIFGFDVASQEGWIVFVTAQRDYAKVG